MSIVVLVPLCQTESDILRAERHGVLQLRCVLRQRPFAPMVRYTDLRMLGTL